MSDSEPVETNLADFEKLLSGQEPEAAVEEEVSEPTPSATENESAPDSDAEGHEDEVVDEDDTPDEEDEPEAEAEAKPKNRRRRNAQDRIDELTQDKYELKRRIAELERLTAEKVEKSENKPTQVKPETDKAPDPDAMSEDGTPLYPLGEFDRQYIADLTRYTIHVENEAAKKAAAEEAQLTRLEAAQQELTENWGKKVAASAERIPDLPEKFSVLQDTFKDIPEDQGNFIASSIMTLENGPDVLAYFADNIDEAKLLMKGGIFETIMALGRLDEKFNEKNKEVDKGVAVKATQAPPPPPKNKGSANVKTIRPDTPNLDDFETLLFSGN